MALPSDPPVPVASLLQRLRWPAAPEVFGVAAWAGLPGRDRPAAEAWVKWDGRTLEALLAQPSPDGPTPPLALRWRVTDTGAAQQEKAQDAAGILGLAPALAAFAAAIAAMGTPGFVTLPTSPSLVRRPRA